MPQQQHVHRPHGAEVSRSVRGIPTLRLFAAAREAANGTTRATVDGATVGDVLDQAVRDYGERFAEVLTTCRIWVNGEPATRAHPVTANDEVAVLPPVSGG